MASILVETATAIAEALTANAFDYGSFVATRAYDSLLPDKNLVAEVLDVRVCQPKPKQIIEAVRHTRGNSSSVFKMSYIAAYDIDICFKFGQASQAANAPNVPIETVDLLMTLTEDIHRFFLANPVIGNADWLPYFQNDRRKVESEILVPYHPSWLRDKRIWYSCCREIFRNIV